MFSKLMKKHIIQRYNKAIEYRPHSIFIDIGPHSIFIDIAVLNMTEQEKKKKKKK
jgi:hypothetical protein